MKPPHGAIVAGPILRYLSANHFTLWVVTRQPWPLSLVISDGAGDTWFNGPMNKDQLTRVRIGTHCFVNLIHVRLESHLPERWSLNYDLKLTIDNKDFGLCDLQPDLLYEQHHTPVFSYNPTIRKMVHGSCRKPHHQQPDALSRLDEMLTDCVDEPEDRPSLLLFSGDQIYVDDVAGPMLCAIHKLIEVLGLFDEDWDGSQINNSRELFESPQCYYERENLLPRDRATQPLFDVLFTGARKPIFTTVNAHNHLISFSEITAMYLLCWSPVPWELIAGWDDELLVAEKHRERFREELTAIRGFVETLPQAARVMAHLPTYMIFDDHDVTDDWNLTRGWEETAYGNPFSRRIIGNALAGFWLCQGWGNLPANYSGLNEELLPHFTDAGVEGHDQLVDQVLAWDLWHFHLATEPKLIVLDTRTHRWRSESSPSQPSGLMDWESLSDLQNELINEPAVIVVSPAPIFGVKLIEVMQKVMTFFGQALMVDAENWMAHPGAANVILNIFQHKRTPPRFTILSGDVHYSFVFNITLRSRRRKARIVQITASGIKNSFPQGLLKWFAHFDRVLFGPRSPLNLLTRRRRLRIKARKASDGQMHGLFNHSGIGVLELKSPRGRPKASVLSSDGRVVTFK